MNSRIVWGAIILAAFVIAVLAFEVSRNNAIDTPGQQPSPHAINQS
jgi:hypothetical protein